MMKEGTIVDAAIFDAPSSTKNEKKEHDPEIRQTKKGNQWYFGMKGHIGVDAVNGPVHTVEATPANVHDDVMAEEHATASVRAKVEHPFHEYPKRPSRGAVRQ
jgi:IS5 family transposase